MMRSLRTRWVSSKKSAWAAWRLSWFLAKPSETMDSSNRARVLTWVMRPLSRAGLPRIAVHKSSMKGSYTTPTSLLKPSSVRTSRAMLTAAWGIP